MACRPFSERRRAARFVDQSDDNAQLNEENENTRVVLDSGNQSVVDDRVHAREEVEVGVHQTANHDSDKQRGINLLGYQRKSDRDDRRKQRPCRSAYHSRTCAGLALRTVNQSRTVTVHALDLSERAARDADIDQKTDNQDCRDGEDNSFRLCHYNTSLYFTFFCRIRQMHHYFIIIKHKAQ